MNDQEKQNEQAPELEPQQLEDVAGGLLLPAVHKVRDAAARATEVHVTNEKLTLNGNG